MVFPHKTCIEIINLIQSCRFILIVVDKHVTLSIFVDEILSDVRMISSVEQDCRQLVCRAVTIGTRSKNLHLIKFEWLGRVESEPNPLKLSLRSLILNVESVPGIVLIFNYVLFRDHVIFDLLTSLHIYVHISKFSVWANTCVIFRNIEPKFGHIDTLGELNANVVMVVTVLGLNHLHVGLVVFIKQIGNG